MFVAVSTNPAIDRVARIEGPAFGVAHATEFLETPGGKAIHAASVAAELGAPVTVVTTAGGRNGELLLELLASEPLEVVPVAVAGDTRGTYTLVGDGGDLVEVHEPSAPLTEQEVERLVAALARLSPAVVAVCGSLPPGAPVDLHARLIAAARVSGAFTILDCSTPDALAAALQAGPDLVAPNADEARDADLRGAAAVWVSLGPDGSVFTDADGSVRLPAPRSARVVNAVGCGDALIGGFAAGLIAGMEPREAAALGAAAAADKLGRLPPGRVERAAVEALHAGAVPT